MIKNKGSKKPCKKRVRIQLRLKPSKKHTRGVIDVVHNLWLSMFKRIRQLTSKKRYKKYMTQTMVVILKRLGTSPRPEKLKKVYRARIPLITDEKEKNIINSWHELSKKRFKYKIIRAFGKIPTTKIAASRYIALESDRFVNCHLYNWVEDYDPKLIENTLDEFRQQGKFIDESELEQPLEEFSRVMLMGDSPTSKKISVSMANRLSARPHPPAKKFKNSGNWRQTTIDEYFKPRRLMIEQQQAICQNNNGFETVASDPA